MNMFNILICNVTEKAFSVNKEVDQYIYMATNPSPSLPRPVGLNFLFLNFDSKI